MSLKIYTASTQESIKLAIAPFAKGGEGSLYKIKSPKKYENYAAKIYHKNKRDRQRQEKINYLIEHPPQFEHPSQAEAVVWPVDILEQNGRFVGYLMPLAQGEKLEILCTPKLPKKLGQAWKRLAFSQTAAMELRIKICFNLAVALYHIHATGHYVIVDLKADNILIRPNGLVAIVDMDSVEVVENNKILFPAPMATPEFTPVEFYAEKGQRQGPILETWDRFAMAVIFYKVLFGIHPFAGSSKAPFEKCVSLADKIQKGLFVHAPEQQQYFSVIPQPHEQFLRLSESLKGLFLQCFVKGHKNPVWRPSAEDWCIALSDGSDIGLVAHRPLLSPLPKFQTMELAPVNNSISQYTADNIYNFVLDKINKRPNVLIDQITSNIRKNSSKDVSNYVEIIFFIAMPFLVIGLFGSIILGFLGIEASFYLKLPFWINIGFISLVTVFYVFWYLFIPKKEDRVLNFWIKNCDDITNHLSPDSLSTLNSLPLDIRKFFFYTLSGLAQQYQNIQQTASNIQHSQKINLQPYIQEQDKKIIQCSKAERKALQELKEALENDRTWQKFKGQQLKTKLHNVESYYNQHHIAKLEEELQQNYQKVDAQFNHLAAQQQTAYYEQLSAIDTKIKEQEQTLVQAYDQQLEVLGNNTPVYKNIQQNLQAAQDAFRQKLNALHSTLSQDINNLEQQQHKNLQKLNERTEKELQNSSIKSPKSLLQKAELEASTLIAMTHQNIAQLKKIYQQRQEKLAKQWLNQEQALDKELLTILEIYISQNREEKALKLQLQQLQHQKRKDKILAELKFSYQRQQTIAELHRAKQKLTAQYNQAVAAVQQEVIQTKAALEQLANHYHIDTKSIKSRYDKQYQSILQEAEQYLATQQQKQEMQQVALEAELQRNKTDLAQQLLARLNVEI